jgi:hypothetical protein
LFPGFCAAVIVGSLFGCSVNTSGGALTPDAASPALEEVQGGELPFTLSIEEEYFNGETLIVFATMRAKREFRPGEVALRLQLLEDGNVVAEREEPVSSFLLAGEDESDGRKLIADLAATPGTSPKAYQIELLWGPEVLARGLLQDVLLAATEIRGDCESCLNPWSTTIVVRNMGAKPVGGLRFLLRLDAFGYSGQDTLFTSGREIELLDLAIEAGESREFVVDLEFYKDALMGELGVSEKLATPTVELLEVFLVDRASLKE